MRMPFSSVSMWQIWLLVRLCDASRIFIPFLKQVSSSFASYTSYFCKANEMNLIELNFNPWIAFELSSALNQIEKIIELTHTRNGVQTFFSAAA